MNPSSRNPAAIRETFTEYADSRDERLRNQLVEEHLGLAHQLARRFTNRGEPYDDLVQVASIGLVKSVDRFDTERGVEFSTFATRTIIGELKRHFRDKGWAIRAPRRIQELYLALGPSVETLTQRLGRPPTVTEIAQGLDTSEESVLEAMEAGQRYRTSSIDAPGRNDDSLASQIGQIDSGYSGTDDRLLLALSLADLSERERTIINLRFVDGLTQSEIAARVGLSQMHVSRLLAASLTRLREAFSQDL
jgi:RNA polymerase sigma-B factor